MAMFAPGLRCKPVANLALVRFKPGACTLKCRYRHTLETYYLNFIARQLYAQTPGRFNIRRPLRSSQYARASLISIMALGFKRN